LSVGWKALRLDTLNEAERKAVIIDKLGRPPLKAVY
jgi:hypothetical protein